MDDSIVAPGERWPLYIGRGSKASSSQSVHSIIIYDPVLDRVVLPESTRRSGIAWRRPIIWLCACVIGIGVGGAMTWCNPLAYRATGLLLGLPSGDALQEEVALIGSDDVMQAIVDQVGAARVAPKCPAFHPECPIDAVRSQLQIHVSGDPGAIDTTPALRVTAIHRDAAVAVAMVGAAVAADRRLWNLAHATNQAASLQPQLAAAEAALGHSMGLVSSLRTDYHVSDIARDTADATAAVRVLDKQLDDLTLHLAGVEADLAVTQAAAQSAPDMVLESREVTSGDPGQDSRALLLQLKLERAHMAQLYTPDYPGMRELNQKILTVETAMKTQAKDAKSTTRDVRNPAMVVLMANAARLTAESASLGQQRAELRRQANLAAIREADLRTVGARLIVLQQRQDAEEAGVRNLSGAIATFQVQDALITAQLSRRRLARLPEATVLPLTGKPAAIASGTMAALAFGMGMTVMGRRRRPFYALVRSLSHIFVRLEREWAPPDEAPDAGLRLVGADTGQRRQLTGLFQATNATAIRGSSNDDRQPS